MIEIKQKEPTMIVSNENGFATMLALMILLLLTLMGISGIKTSNFELQSATNDNLHKMAFYSAEASRAYVMTNPDFYGVTNIDTSTPHLFPNNSNPYVPITGGTVAPFNLGNSNSFSGFVQYAGSATPPRGSGYDTSKFRAHTYLSNATGNGPRNTTEQIEVGFYRIGL